jgi:cyclopropane fatty-acyl-phospholipid synthase-like methyltransferase
MSALAGFKADYINSLVSKHNIETVVEFGCGDGQQLSAYNFPEYLGLDVSKTVIKSCISQFSGDNTKSFELYDPSSFDPNEEFDLTLSIDVLYHLVEQDVFEKHLTDLFRSSAKWVVVYSCDFDQSGFGAHVQPRKFTDFVKRQFPEFELVDHTVNPYPLEEYGPEKGSWSDFYTYLKQSES